MLQFEAAECGAASLSIVLAYYRRLVPLEELRTACGVSRDGSKAINIVRAARQYGLEAEGLSCDLDGLRDVDPPYIVFWNFNHFLVVEGLDRDTAYLNDPAYGPRRVPITEFSKSYTGIALTFTPGEKFRPGGQRPSLFASLAPHLKGSHTALLYVVLIGLALMLPAILNPTFQRVFVDEYLVQGLDHWIRPMLWLMLATALFAGTATWLQHYHLMRLQMKLAVSMSSRFFWHILRLPAEFFSQRFAGEIGSRVQLNDQVATLLSGKLATTLINLLTIGFYALLLFSDEWSLTIIGVVMASLNLLSLKYVSRQRVDGNHRLIQERGRLVATSMAGLQMIETVKASGMEDDYFARFAGQEAIMVNANQQLGAWSVLLDNVPTLLSALNGCAILCIGAYDVISGHMSVGTLVAFQVLMGYFIGPFAGLVNMGSAVQEAEGDLNRINDVLKAPLDVLAPAVTKTTASDFPHVRLDGYLDLQRVTFGYSRLDPPLIEDFSLSLSPGQRVALVGKSGSGKSTVASLVCGFYLPWTGAVVFDRLPRERIPRNVFLSSFSMVSQDIFLFEGTVMDNLTLWDRTVNKQAVVQAAMDADIHDEIVGRPGGFYSWVEEGGANFSGGQRQRIEIARALVLNPTLVVLDEATSALDPITEFHVQQNLRRRGCSCLLIAHRLSTIRDCDEIIMLDRGKVLERGTHETLVANQGPYYRLVSTA